MRRTREDNPEAIEEGQTLESEVPARIKVVQATLDQEMKTEPKSSQSDGDKKVAEPQRVLVRCIKSTQIQRFRRHFDLQNDAILHLIL